MLSNEVKQLCDDKLYLSVLVGSVDQAKNENFRLLYRPVWRS